MDGDFSWLWRNEELSDFILLIRPNERGRQTRAGKRRRTAHSTPPSSGAPAAIAAAAGEAGSSSQAAGAAGVEARRVSRRRAGHAADNAAPGAEQQEQQEQPQEGQGQQQPHNQQQQAQQGVQPANTRLTRRRQQQQQQQHDQQQVQQQQPNQQMVQPNQQDPQQQAPYEQQQQQQQQEQQHGQQQDQQPAGQAGPAAAAASGRRRRRHGHSHAHNAQGAQQDGAAAAGNLQNQATGGSGRVTRASSRTKKRSSDGAAPGTAAAGAGAGGDRTATAAAGQQQGPESAPAAAGPSSRAGSKRNQQLQQQGAGTSAAAAGDAGAGSSAAAAAAAAAAVVGSNAQQQQQQVAEIRLPVHAVVLAGFSEYFKALICSWSGNLNRTLTLDVGVDEGHAAELMVEFMYTGKLPTDAQPDELLRMIRLADQYQVTRFLAAASSSFESLPLASLSLGVVLEVFGLPQLMLDAPEMGRVVSKARAKLLELYGDLEKVWASEVLREQFLALPLPAVRCLLSSEVTAVAAENTALVALAGWVEEGAAGRGATPPQRKELLSLIRLPYLTSSFIGDILHSVPWIRDALDSRQLLNAFQFAAASESTRQRLASYEYGPSAATPHFRCPRPLSPVTRASFEWSIDLSTIKRMVADAKLWGRVVELSSPLHYFAGFWWQLLFNVEKTPTPPDAQPDVAAAAAATVVEFVGVRCHVNCGAHDYWPRVVRFKASIAALQTGFWEMDYAYMKAIEGPIVDGVGLGYPGFFALPGQALENEAAWSRFVRQGRVQLRCEVLDCE